MGCFYSFLNKTGCQILTYSSFLLIRKMKLIGIHRLSRSFPPRTAFVLNYRCFNWNIHSWLKLDRSIIAFNQSWIQIVFSPIFYFKKWLWFIKKLTRMEYKYTKFSKKKKDYPCTYIIMRVPFLLKAGFSCNVWLIKYINFNSNRNNKL